MAQGLEWVFTIRDQVSAPIKGMIEQMGRLDSGLKTNDQHFDQVGQSIEGLRGRLERLKAGRDGSFRTDHIRRYNGMIKETEQQLRKLEDLPPSQMRANWDGLLIVANQASQLFGKVADSLSFTSEIKQLETDIRRFTGLTGEELDKATSKVHELGAVFRETPLEIARAANAMTDQIGGTYEENLALIGEGFQRGANLNRNMLEQLSEYGPQLKSAGITASQGLAIMAQAAEKGIMTDKALDAIKEAGLSLREMDKAQEDALAGIGLNKSDLVGKSTFDAIQMVSKSMEGMTAQAKQLVLADIFKGAGEDAGAAFIEGLHTMSTDLSSLPAVEEAGAGFRSFFSQIKTSVTAAVGDISPYVDIMGGLGTAMIGLGPIFKSQQVATVLLTAKQWLLNIAMNANPIGLIIAGVAALIAVLVVVYNKFDTFRGIVHGAWDGLKSFGSLLWEGVIGAIKGLLSGISGVGKALRHLFAGEWGKAADAGMKAVKGFVKATPAGMIAGVVQNFGEVGEAAARGYNEGFNKNKEDPEAVNINKTTGTSNIRQPSFQGLSFSEKTEKEKLSNAAAAETATAIVTGGRRHQTFNIRIDKVLENVTQEVTEGQEAADELVDMVLERLLRRLGGTVRSLAT